MLIFTNKIVTVDIHIYPEMIKIVALLSLRQIFHTRRLCVVPDTPLLHTFSHLLLLLLLRLQVMLNNGRIKRGFFQLFSRDGASQRLKKFLSMDLLLLCQRNFRFAISLFASMLDSGFFESF